MKYLYQLVLLISLHTFCLELELSQPEFPVMEFKAEIKYTTEQNKIYEALVFQAGYSIVKIGAQYGLNIKSLNAVRTDEKNANLLRPSALYLVCQHAKLQQNDLDFILINDVIKNFKSIKEKRIPSGWRQGSIKIVKISPKWIS